MAKKDYKEEKKEDKKETKQEEALALPPNLPPEVADKLKHIKEKLEKFQKNIVEKFDKYIVGVALLPPPRPPQQNAPPEILEEEQKRYEAEKDKYHTLVLIDDSEPTKMTKQELKDKLSTIIDKSAEEIDKNILPQTILLSELWQNCYDAKYDLLQLIGMSAPIYDTGMLGAIRIAEIHKTMVLKKFEKYIVAYVMAGSLIQGRATKDSDIDVFIVIDDTDVKKMTRTELRDKLRAIIIGMGMEAGEMTGIRNKLNIQIYILTDFWDSIRESNPVIFTFLRDGVPFYDRGIFMPWKQLLKMGKIRPSTEAIDMFMQTGEQALSRVNLKLKDIATEDFFWGIHTPTQAALMLYGIPPPTPKETCELLREVFVKKEKLLEEEYVKILENVIKVRKDIEHGTKTEVSGKEIDKLLSDSDKYMKRLKKLFTQIEKIKEEESVLHIHDTAVTVVRDALKLEGEEKVSDEHLLKKFEDKLVHTGGVPSKYSRTFSEIIKSKEKYVEGKLSKTDVDKIRKESNELIRALVDYIQRKRVGELERARLRIKHGDDIGEVTVLGNTAFILRNVDDKQMEKASIQPDGSLWNISSCSIEEYEKALAKLVPQRIALKNTFLEGLRAVFGANFEVLV
jgi:uncharacterized protein (UPF0332 family)/predicted nucleotidyltransferase